MNDKKQDNAGPGVGRRDFLKRGLRTAGYTAPIVLAMSMKNLASAQASGPLGMGGMAPMGMGMP